jgi:hypothetical protein
MLRVIGMLLALALASSSAMAGSLYINGVLADGVRAVELERVNVEIDAVGNILISAPSYVVQVSGDAPRYQAPSNTRYQATPQNVTPVQPALSPSISQGGPWWLVTEDGGSVGQTVEVRINDTLIHTVRSGQGQVILDITAYVQAGANTVTFNASTTANGAGAPLHIYLGKGESAGGTLRLNEPQVDYKRDPRTPAPTVAQQYTLRVD